MSVENFVESNASKRIKAFFKKKVDAGKLNERLLLLKYDPRKREKVTTESGELDYAAVYKSLGVDYPESILLERIIQLNLTDNELRDVIEERFSQLYPDYHENFGVQSLFDTGYPGWCERFGVESDPEFGIPLKEESIVLEYFVEAVLYGKKKIRLYENGKVDFIEIDFDAIEMKSIEHIQKEITIAPEQVKSYAERLIEENFYEYEHKGYVVFGNYNESLTLNYQGRTRTVNKIDRSGSLFPDIVDEIRSLKDQQ